MVKVKEKYYKTKYTPTGIFPSVNAMIYFKFILQLKFRNNKNYSSIGINFHTGLCQKKIH